MTARTWICGIVLPYEERSSPRWERSAIMVKLGALLDPARTEVAVSRTYPHPRVSMHVSSILDLPFRDRYEDMFSDLI